MIMFFQIQFGKSILSVLIPGFSGPGEVVHCLDGILCHNFTPEVFLPQTVGGAVVSDLSSILQPLHSQCWVMNFRIIGEQNLSHLIRRSHMALPGSLLKPVEGCYAVRNPHRAILVELADKILCVQITVLRDFYELCRCFVPFRQRIGAALLAFGIQLSIDYGYGGAIYLKAKTTEIREHYIRDFGAIPFSRYDPFLLLIDGDAARELFSQYLEEE